MAEKRKPASVWLLRKLGKQTHKIEIFPARLWPKKFFPCQLYDNLYCRVRVRVNGRWWNRKDGRPSALTKSEFRDALFRSLHVGFWQG